MVIFSEIQSFHTANRATYFTRSPKETVMKINLSPLLIGGVIAAGALLACAFWWPRAALLVPAANAQNKSKTPNTQAFMFIEFGPERFREHTQTINILAEKVAQKSRYSIWGRRFSYSNNIAEYTVRIQGNMGGLKSFAFVLDVDSVTEFVKYAKRIKERAKDLKVQKPSEGFVIKYESNDLEGNTFSLDYDITKDMWDHKDFEFPGLVEEFEKVLKDIEGIKSNKAPVPW